jgi:hypothetical protein
MKIGFFAIGLANLARPDLLGLAAQTAESVGIDTLCTGEHIVFSAARYRRGRNGFRRRAQRRSRLRRCTA